MGQEGELTQWPLFSGLPPGELPWDVASAIQHRKFRTYTERRVDMEKNDMPSPTPRTMASPTGFRMWEKFIEEEKKDQREKPESYKDPMQRWERLVPGACLAYDYKVWAEYGELVIWHREHVRAYRQHEIADAEPGGEKPPKESEIIRDFSVYGSVH